MVLLILMSFNEILFDYKANMIMRAEWKQVYRLLH